MAKKSNVKKKTGGVIARAALYQHVSQYSKDAIDVLVDLMKNAAQESVRMGAAKALLDKALPDLKATEHTGEEGGPIEIRIIEDIAKHEDE